MPIDPREVRWDDAPAVDPAKVQWDDAPAQRQSASQPIGGGARFAQGLRDPIDGGAQLLTKMLPDGVVQAGNRLNNWLADNTGLVGRLPEGGVDQQVREREAAYQAARGADAGVDWARIAGNVASPANLAIGSRIPQAATTLGKVAAGAAGGAASSALNPVANGDFADQKLMQMGVGAAGGAAVPAVVAGVGRLVSPAASRNPQLQLLQQEGVRPTIGQTLGGRWNTAEEKLTSVPILGDAISAARERARKEFNQAAINRVTSPLGRQVNGVGQEGVARAGNLVSEVYDQAKNQLGNFRLDHQGVGELQTLRQTAQQLPDETTRGQFEKVWRTVANDVSPNGTIKADAFKRIDSKLAKEAARFTGSPDAYQQMLGDAIGEVRSTITSNALRANPRAAAMMKSADTAYANLVRVEGASKGAMNSGGLFTPGQLGTAVRQADQSMRDRATARGAALMQDLAGAGQQVLGNRVPNSGTADRLMLGAGGLGAGFYNPMIPAALLGGAALYTSPLQGLLRGAVTARPQGAAALRQGLLQMAPALTPAGAQVGTGLLNTP